MTEIWKDVVGYEKHYKISNLGRVKTLKKGIEKIRKQSINYDGYANIILSKNGIAKQYKTHRLVALNFIENTLNKETVNHINGIKTDNRVINLEWATRSENMQHAVDTGLKKKVYMKGEKNGSSKLKIEDILYIRNNYKPRDNDFNRKKLSEKFGVSINCIAIIISKKRWKHI